ncbi:MAG: glycosyltransferase [Rhodothermales bacterium]|nr:glycosyltransferase [Rhodothermales bacterium]
MTALLAAVLLAAGAWYAVVLGGFAVGFRRVARERHAELPDAALPFVSVIVPARDEAHCIARCLRAVLANDYPEDRFEVIVVDDLSRDGTAERVERVQARVNRPALVPAGFEDDGDPGVERVRLLRMPENLERSRAHKKRAITKGIAAARGAIILTTDADCLVPRRWVRTMAEAFDAETALVSGPVLYRPGTTAAGQVQALEFLGLVAVGAGAIGIGRPTLCNGANVAYRKGVFEALGGFDGLDHLTSGDDELFMQKIAYTTGWAVRFCADRRAAVLTKGADSLRGFVEQRRRWASKGAHYPYAGLVAAIAGIYAFYVALLAATLALPVAPALALPVAAAWGLKALPEAALLGPACRHFGRGRLLRYFLPTQPLHLAYIIAMGALGAIGNYEWKGRQIAR